MPWLHGLKTTNVSTLDVIATTPRPLKPQCARLLLMPVCAWWCTGGPAPAQRPIASTGFIKRFDLGAFSIGAGAWAGAQEGAERLDVGPSMRVDLAIAQATARFSLDYRERVAGDAEPQSGVAVTLSTHF